MFIVVIRQNPETWTGCVYLTQIESPQNFPGMCIYNEFLIQAWQRKCASLFVLGWSYFVSCPILWVLRPISQESLRGKDNPCQVPLSAGGVSVLAKVACSFSSALAIHKNGCLHTKVCLTLLRHVSSSSAYMFPALKFSKDVSWIRRRTSATTSTLTTSSVLLVDLKADLFLNSLGQFRWKSKQKHPYTGQG